jgi:serine/threonine-protein kinase
MGPMTGPGGGSEGSGTGDSIDSFLRDVARAPEKAPLDATARSPGEVAPKIRLEAGTVVGGRFRLERRLGEGGMGVVWHAVHAVTRKPVAMKFLKDSAASDPRAVQRFLREARAACAVQHPCVVAVHDVLELEDGSPVMVMDLLVGETFADRLAREGALPLPEVARTMVHVCSAVGCAHALGIVHRDLKPENIFLARSLTGATQVKVLDFGIAKLTAAEGDAAHTGGTTGTGAILGTPYYMAPEQLFGEKDVDHRADIWALGIILYEALAGARPTQAANMGQIYKLVTTGGLAPISKKVPNLPGPVVNLVSRMLSRDRALRPADVREVLVTLSAYTDEAFVPVEAAPVRGASSSEPSPEPTQVDPARASTVDAATIAIVQPPEVPPPPPLARRPWPRTALLVGTAGLLVPLTFAAWLSRGPRPTPETTPTVQQPSPLASTEPTEAAAERLPPPPALPVPLPTPSAVASSTEAAPSSSREPKSPRLPSPLPRHAPAPAPSPAAPAAPSSPRPTPAVDPGSYQ